MMIPHTTDSTHHHVTFFVMVAVALIFGRIRYLSAPFVWMEVFFHEISHGLAALLTGGRMSRIILTLRGSGTCVTYGGSSIIVLLAGYSGAAAWGAAIYGMGKWAGSQAAQDIMFVLLLMLLLVTIFFVRDIVTFAVMIFMATIFWIPNRYPAIEGLEYLLQFIGIFITLSAIKAPLALWNAPHAGGDSAELARRTLIPETLWILLWFFMGILTLAYMWQLPLTPSERILTFLPFLA